MLPLQEPKRSRIAALQAGYIDDLLGVISKPIKLSTHLTIYLNDGMFYDELTQSIESSARFFHVRGDQPPRIAVRNFFRDFALVFYRILFDIIIFGLKERDTYLRNCIAGKLFSKILIDDIFGGSSSPNLIKTESEIFQALNHPLRRRILFDLRDTQEPIRFDDLLKMESSREKIEYHLKLLKDQEAISLESDKILPGRDFSPMLAAIDLIEKTADRALKKGLTFGSIMYSKDDFQNIIWSASGQKANYLRKLYYCSFEPIARSYEALNQIKTRDDLQEFLDLHIFKKDKTFPIMVFEEETITSHKLADIVIEGGALVVDNSKNIKGFILPTCAASVRQTYSQWIKAE